MSFSEEIIDLKCSICLHRFHDPIILNCGHTFNRLCIEKLIDSNKSLRSIKCPLCNHSFDPEKPLISNKSLADVLQYESSFEWFLIDISSSKQKTTILKFLKHVFNKREISQINHITFETENTRLTFNSNTNFDQQLEIKSLSNLGEILQEIYDYLQQQNGLRKIFILTDGSKEHLNVIKIDSNIIPQRFIIHIGDKNILRTRQLADKINFQFGYFNEKTVEIYVQHFIKNFCN